MKIDYLQLLLIVLPLVAGPFAMLAFDGLKHLVSWLDESPSYVKAIAAPVFAFLVGLLASHFGISVPSDVHSWTPDTIAAVATALVQAGVFRWRSVHGSAT